MYMTTTHRFSHARQALRPAGCRAFTLIELLVVIGIIAVLAGLIFVSFRGVQTGATFAKSSNALREIMRGYLTYATDHNQALLPGHVAPGDFASNGGPLEIPTAYSFKEQQLGFGDSASYVWRLLPYIDNKVTTLTTDYGSARFDTIINGEVQQNIYGPDTVGGPDYGIALVPSYGLNSMYLGGNSVHGPIPNRAPWLSDDPIAATRISQVRNPGNVIVFAPTQMINPPAGFATKRMADDIIFGSAELRPPYVDGVEQWTYNSGDRTITGIDSFTNFGGAPIARRSDERVPTAHADGSVNGQDIGELGRDSGTAGSPQLQSVIMRKWNPFATGVN